VVVASLRLLGRAAAGSGNGAFPALVLPSPEEPSLSVPRLRVLGGDRITIVAR
jgi:hypothetical protein